MSDYRENGSAANLDDAISESGARESACSETRFSPRRIRHLYARSVLLIASTGIALIAAGEALVLIANTKSAELPAALLIGVGAATQALLLIPAVVASRGLDIGKVRSALRFFFAPFWILVLFVVPGRSPICLVGLLGIAVLAMPFRLQSRALAPSLLDEEVMSDGAPRGRRLSWLGRSSVTLYGIAAALTLGLLTGGLFSPTPVFDEMSNPEWSGDSRWISYTQGTVDLSCPMRRLDKRENLSESVFISSPDGRDRHGLADAPYVNGATWSPATPVVGAWVATESAAPSEWATFRVEPDGRSMPINAGAQGRWTALFGPSWSPTGDRVAWVGLITPEAVAELVISDPDGSRPVWVRVTDARVGIRLSDRSWSPNGDRLAYWARDKASAQQGVWTVRSDGTDHRFIATTGRGWATWSPDGLAIAIASFDREPPELKGLWTLDPSDGSHHLVTDLAGSDVWSAPLWSPSSREIALVLGSDWIHQPRTTQLLVFSATSNQSSELVSLTYRDYSDPCTNGHATWFHAGGWHDDGHQFLYAVKAGGRSGVYIVDTDTREVTAVASRARWVSRIRVGTTDAPSWVSICAPRHNLESDVCR